MARSEARLSVSIWSDPDFLDCTPSEQRMFMFLLSQPDLAHDGVIALRERRWSRSAKGLTVEQITKDLTGLDAARFIVVDWDNEELLIRSFIRRDKVYRQPNVLRAAADHLDAVTSPLIRHALAVELARIAELDMPGDAPATVAQMRRTLPDPSGNPPPNPSGNPHRVEPKPSREGRRSPVDSQPKPAERTVVDTPLSGVDAGKKGSENPSPKAPEERGKLLTVSKDSSFPDSSIPRHPRNPRPLSRPARAVVEALGCDDDDGQWIADEVHRRHRPHNLAGYLRRMAEAGDLAPLLAERHPPPQHASVAVVDPPCGQCGPNRLVELDDGRAARCPTCHPLRPGAAA